jgi:hypothetical protein
MGDPKIKIPITNALQNQLELRVSFFNSRAIRGVPSQILKYFFSKIVAMINIISQLSFIQIDRASGIRVRSSRDVEIALCELLGKRCTSPTFTG